MKIGKGTSPRLFVDCFQQGPLLYMSCSHEELCGDDPTMNPAAEESSEVPAADADSWNIPFWIWLRSSVSLYKMECVERGFVQLQHGLDPCLFPNQVIDFS